VLSTRILGLDVFLTLMVMLVVGGIGRFPGALIGALLVSFVSEMLRPAGVYRGLIFGAMVVLLILLVMSATGIYILENELQPETFGSIPSSMWWAIVTLTTVGYGDVVPLTAMGRVFGGLIGLLGIGMIALPAAILASGFVENIHDRKEKYNIRAERALRDGVLDEQERWELEELRKELGLESDEALQLLRSVMERGRRAVAKRCPHCGKHI